MGKNLLIAGLLTALIGTLAVIYLQNKPKINLSGAVERVSAGNKAECEKNGGRWQFVGDLPNSKQICNEKMDDAGKSCTDGSDCLSHLCAAPDGIKVKGYADRAVGQCYGWKYMESCMRIVSRGVVAEICH